MSKLIDSYFGNTFGRWSQFRNNVLILLIFNSFIFCSALCQSENNPKWQKLETGLHLGDFKAPISSHLKNSNITVLKINPQHFNFNIYCATEHGKQRRSAKRWANDFKLTAAINAGMYATDYLTSVGYLKSKEHINNGHLNDRYNCIFACGPTKDDISPVQVIDRRCQDFNNWKDKYHSFSQSIRMISCNQGNVWEQQPEKWSIACLAVDKSGNVLFIHCRSPYSVHDFINMLLQLPLEIYNAMYLEGGPEASLYFNSGDAEKELFGIYESRFFLSDDNDTAWKIPNVIGIKRKME